MTPRDRIKETLKAYKVYASPFCKHHGIRIDAVHKFSHPQITDDGKLILDLSTIVKVSLSGRKGRGTATK